MGNCQAAEAATVVIQHPNGKLERVYWSLSANHVMAANPGHYVALIISTTNNNNNTLSTHTATPNNNSSSCSSRKKLAAATSVKHMKLLRPDDTLRIGNVYRLVSFEEVLKEFASKKRVKLSRLLANDEEEKSRPLSGNNAITSAGGSTVSSGRERQRPFGMVTEQRRSKAASVSHNQLVPQIEQHQHQQEAEAKLDEELEELVNRMMLADNTETRQAGGHDIGHVGAPIARHCQWKPALQSISEVGS